MYKTILYYILIILTIYTDSPLQSTFGEFGTSPVPIVSIVLWMMMVISGNIKIRSDFVHQFNKLLKYTCVLSFIALIIFVLFEIPLTIKGQFLPVKAVKILLYFVGYISFINVIINLTYDMTLKQVIRPFFWTFIILTVILFMEIPMRPYAFPDLHFHNTEPYYRIRLLTSESSWTALQIELFFALAFYYTKYIKKSNVLTILVIACMFAHIANTESKTLLFALFIAYITMFMDKNKNSTASSRILTFIIAGAGIYALINYLLPYLGSAVTRDIEESTSIVTRTYTVVLGFLIGTIMPMGTGFQSYLYVLPEAMESNLNYITSISSDLNVTEILAYAQSNTDEGLSCKSFLSQTCMYWGILGTIYFLRINKKLSENAMNNAPVQGQYILKGLAIVLLVQAALSSGMGYEICAFWTVLIYLKDNYNENTVCY